MITCEYESRIPCFGIAYTQTLWFYTMTHFDITRCESTHYIYVTWINLFQHSSNWWNLMHYSSCRRSLQQGRFFFSFTSYMNHQEKNKKKASPSLHQLYMHTLLFYPSLSIYVLFYVLSFLSFSLPFYTKVSFALGRSASEFEITVDFRSGKIFS